MKKQIRRFLVGLVANIFIFGVMTYANAKNVSGKEEQQQITSGSAIVMARVDPNMEYYRNLFYNYFEDGYFETRDNGVCLTLHPKLWAWSDTDKSNAWMSVYANFYRDWRWDNTSIMKKQFYCHARFIYQLVEREWNLEPWRTEMDPIDCN